MGTGAELPFPVEKQARRLSSALGDHVKEGLADRAGWLSLRSACYYSRQRGQLPGP